MCFRVFECSEIHRDLTNHLQIGVCTPPIVSKLLQPPPKILQHQPTRCLRQATHHCLPKPPTPATTKKSASSISDATHGRSPPVVVPPAYFCVSVATNIFEKRPRRWNGCNPTRRRSVICFLVLACSKIHRTHHSITNIDV